MEPDERRLLREIQDDVATLGRGMTVLVEAIKTMAAMQAETLRQILEAVTAPIPESKVPALLDKIIALVEDEATAVHCINQGVVRIENGVNTLLQ